MNADSREKVSLEYLYTQKPALLEDRVEDLTSGQSQGTPEVSQRCFRVSGTRDPAATSGSLIQETVDGSS